MWGDKFFKSLALSFGVFVCVDEDTKMKNSMDVARFSLITKCFDKLSKVFNVAVNGIRYLVFVVEDSFRPVLPSIL